MKDGVRAVGVEMDLDPRLGVRLGAAGASRNAGRVGEEERRILVQARLIRRRREGTPKRAA
jgi:hypothetical protein